MRQFARLSVLIPSLLACTLAQAQKLEEIVEKEVKQVKEAPFRAAPAAKADILYVYTIEVFDLLIPRTDAVSAAIVDTLQSDALSEQCVDFRELGVNMLTVIRDRRVEHRMVHATEGIVMNSEIPEASKENLRKAICGDQLNCRSRITLKTAEISKITVESLGLGRSDAHPREEPTQRVRLNAGVKIPRFSSGCSTGRHRDSWNDTASTKEAREFLKGIGIDIRKTRTLHLLHPIAAKDKEYPEDPDETELWSLGFPDHSRDEKP